MNIYYGDMVLYRGKPYPIREKSGARAGFDGEVFFMPPNLDSAEIREVLIKIYRKLAKSYLSGRTFQIADVMKVSPSSVKINGAVKRWGSCSSKKSINFSWRLVLAEDETIDYVIVHELAHLTEMNHGAGFWKIVETVFPEHKKQKDKLKILHQKLILEGWG
jgi:predicted metal-dependent hydrolase